MSRFLIQCYPWEQAPAELQALSTDGVAQDWIVVFPVSLLTTYQDHPLLGECLGGSRVSQHDHPSDSHYTVFIGSRDATCEAPEQ